MSGSAFRDDPAGFACACANARSEIRRLRKANATLLRALRDAEGALDTYVAAHMEPGCGAIIEAHARTLREVQRALAKADHR